MSYNRYFKIATAIAAAKVAGVTADSSERSPAAANQAGSSADGQR
jgi:hypothetical protein